MYPILILCIAVFTLVSVIDFKGLYCSSEDLIEAFNNPTTYCKVTGIFNFFKINEIMNLLYRGYFSLFLLKHDTLVVL